MMFGKVFGLFGFNYILVEEIIVEYFRLFLEFEEKSVEELKNLDGIFLLKKRFYIWEFVMLDGKVCFMVVEWIFFWEGLDDKYFFVFMMVRFIGYYNIGEMMLRSLLFVRFMGELKVLISCEDVERFGI